MISKDTSSVSPKTNGQGPMTYERLQQEPQKLRRVRELVLSPEWETLEDLLVAERQALLERLAESEDSLKFEVFVGFELLVETGYSLTHPTILEAHEFFGRALHNIGLLGEE